MKVEIDATWNQINKVIALIKDDPDLDLIKQHLIDAKGLNDDKQGGELSQEGNNATINLTE